MKPALRELRDSALALLAGATLPLAFAPSGAWPLTLLCPALLLLAWQEGSTARLAWRGWLFGFGLFASGASWVYVSMHLYGGASVALAVLLTGLFCAGLGLFGALQGALFGWWRSGRWTDACLLFPILWVLGEWLRSWLLTGFPWLYIGTPHVDTWLGGWAPFLGVFAIGGLLALNAGVAVQAFLSRQRRMALVAIGVIAASWLGGLGLSAIRWVTPQAAISTALVQGNVPQLMKWDPGFRERTLDLYARMTRPYWGRDLIVWPEAALPVLLDQAADWLGARDREARESGSTLLTGIPSRQRQADGTQVYHNSVIAMGYGVGSYHKRHLVPFGEYVPLQSLLRGLIAFFDLPMSDFQPGENQQAPLQAGAWAVAPLVCYEIAYPDYTARQAQAANLIVTLSNDTWFGRSIGPHQHLQIARLRALETGRPVIRATNNGLTALVDHHGHVTAEAPQFETTVLTGSVQPTTGQTLFDVWGSWPVVILAALGLLALMPYRRTA